MGGLALGPFALSPDRLAAAVALAALFGLAALLARRSGEALERWATRSVLGGLLAARAGFVAGNLDAFAEAPWTVLAVWQGGFSWPLGALGVGAVTAGHLLRHPGHGLAAALALGGAATAWGAASGLAAPPAAPPLPSGGLVALDGRSVDLSDRDGRPLVLNLWASWCPPCRREMPMMMEVAADSRGVELRFANQGEEADAIRAYLEVAGLAQDGVVADPSGTLLARYGVPGLPATLFFTAQGRLERIHLGEISRPLLLSRIDELAAAPSPEGAAVPPPTIP